MLAWLLSMYVRAPSLILFHKQHSIIVIHTAFTLHRFDESLTDHLKFEGGCM